MNNIIGGLLMGAGQGLTKAPEMAKDLEVLDALQRKAKWDQEDRVRADKTYADQQEFQNKLKSAVQGYMDKDQVLKEQHGALSNQLSNLDPKSPEYANVQKQIGGIKDQMFTNLGAKDEAIYNTLLTHDPMGAEKYNDYILTNIAKLGAHSPEAAVKVWNNSPRLVNMGGKLSEWADASRTYEEASIKAYQKGDNKKGDFYNNLILRRINAAHQPIPKDRGTWVPQQKTTEETDSMGNKIIKNVFTGNYVHSVTGKIGTPGPDGMVPLAASGDNPPALSPDQRQKVIDSYSTSAFPSDVSATDTAEAKLKGKISDNELASIKGEILKARQSKKTQRQIAEKKQAEIDATVRKPLPPKQHIGSSKYIDRKDSFFQ